MMDLQPPSSWKWAGTFLWLSIHYDHQFEEIDSRVTKLIWTVSGEGFGVAVAGRLFAVIYNMNLDKAIPLLQRELNSSV